jgi:hypothetical protein
MYFDTSLKTLAGHIEDVTVVGVLYISTTVGVSTVGCVRLNFYYSVIKRELNTGPYYETINREIFNERYVYIVLWTKRVKICRFL